MAPLMLIQCGSPTLPCCCAKRYENAVVCICLRCAPFTLEWKPTCTHQHLASVARGKRPQSAFICESTDPAGVQRYLWTPAAISCDGNMTLGGGRLDTLTFTPLLRRGCVKVKDVGTALYSSQNVSAQAISQHCSLSKP